jgi:hypothetical protein
VIDSEFLRRTALPPPEQELLDDGAARAEVLEPARRLERYFAQPFFVTEALIGQAASDIPIEEVIRICQRILNGEASPADESKALTGVRTIEGSGPQWTTAILVTGNLRGADAIGAPGLSSP